MAQSHGFEFRSFGSNHTNQFVPLSAFGQHRRRVSSGRDWREVACQVLRRSRGCIGAFVIVRLSERDIMAELQSIGWRPQC
jgi:hypothetical protein